MTINITVTKSPSSSVTHTVADRLEIQTPFLTWLLVQNLLEFGPLVLHGLLHEVRPQALDGEVHHVGLHQAQDTKDLPEDTANFIYIAVFYRKNRNIVGYKLWSCVNIGQIT